MIFIKAPTFIISTVFIPDGSNAIAFGGVETGKMNAKEVISVGVSISSNGFVSVPLANSARIGISIEADAVFEATCNVKTHNYVLLPFKSAVLNEKVKYKFTE